MIRSQQNQPMRSNPQQLLVYCRAGFEKECAAEIAEHAAIRGVAGFVKTKPDSAYVVFVAHEGDIGSLASIAWDDLVFARQIVTVSPPIQGLPEINRIPPLAAAAKLGGPYGELWLEYPDTNDGKMLSGFCRRFTPILEKSLRASGLIKPDAAGARRLHIFFLDTGSAYVGSTDPGRSAPWPIGIPRLKMPGGAPSRSTLKLAEAFMVFLTPGEQIERLHEGLTAVDLGAAPGGWTWQLMKRGLQVTAVDNGALDASLAEAVRLGQIEHLRSDGLHYRPRRSVHWLVCDMVDKPSRVAALVAEWIAEGHASEAIFNLKLPMKKRREELELCRQLIEARLDAKRMSFRLRFKQLYHDREEVTGHLRAS
jgi:23S rRNA (cytidine2498-2'-O)-methyltransferase